MFDRRFAKFDHFKFRIVSEAYFNCIWFKKQNIRQSEYKSI